MKVADRYLKREVLGEGTYGVIYKAIDTKTGQVVAIKKIRLGKQKEGVNFTTMREIKLVKELKDPNIIVLIDAFPHKGNLHFVFEFMETDMEAVIRDGNTFLSPADIKMYIQITLKGLAFCHRKWVLLRDMKPNNLLIGPGGQLKLADRVGSFIWMPRSKVHSSEKREFYLYLLIKAGPFQIKVLLTLCYTSYLERNGGEYLSEEEANKKIYFVCTTTYQGFGALISEEQSYKLKGR